MMTEALEERIARIERLLGINQQEGTETDRELVYGDERLDIGSWLQSRVLPGESINLMVIMLPDGAMSSLFSWKPDEPVRIEQKVFRKTAALCEALASEVRLSILQELFAGPKTTAELLQAVNLDRSQLYHHLRDLFVHGLVVQPERGRYKATDEGRMIFLAASHLAYVGPETIRSSSELDMGD